MNDQQPAGDAHEDDRDKKAPSEAHATRGPEPAGETAQWYYSILGTSYGPVTENNLKSLARQGAFGPQDYVYAPFLDDWVRADSVYGLFEDAGGAAARAAPQPAHVEAPAIGSPEALTYRTQYAGFWIRAAAVIIDRLVLYIPNCTISATLTLPLSIAMQRAGAGSGPSGEEKFFAVWFVMSAVQFIARLLVGWLYFGLMESSRWQATLGKRAVGIMVTDPEGRRLTFARASGRFFASILSWPLTIGVGYIMAAFTERGQTLHDLIAGTVVVYGRQRPAGPPK